MNNTTQQVATVEQRIKVSVAGCNSTAAHENFVVTLLADTASPVLLGDD